MRRQARDSAHRTEAVERLRRVGLVDGAGLFTEAAYDIARETWDDRGSVKPPYRLLLMWFNLEIGQRRAAGEPFGIEGAPTENLKRLAIMAEKRAKAAAGRP